MKVYLAIVTTIAAVGLDHYGSTNVMATSTTGASTSTLITKSLRQAMLKQEPVDNGGQLSLVFLVAAIVSLLLITIIISCYFDWSHRHRIEERRKRARHRNFVAANMARFTHEVAHQLHDKWLFSHNKVKPVQQQDADATEIKPTPRKKSGDESQLEVDGDASTAAGPEDKHAPRSGGKHGHKHRRRRKSSQHNGKKNSGRHARRKTRRLTPAMKVAHRQHRKKGIRARVPPPTAQTTPLTAEAKAAPQKKSEGIGARVPAPTVQTTPLAEAKAAHQKKSEGIGVPSPNEKTEKAKEDVIPVLH